MTIPPILGNYVNGKWYSSEATETLDVINPATLEILAKVPLSPATELNQAAEIAQQSFDSWRRTPVTERIRYLFKLRELLEQNQQDLAQTITLECGKTLAESVAELQRAIDQGVRRASGGEGQGREGAGTQGARKARR